MSPDDQIRDVLPRLEDGVTLAPGTYQLLVQVKGKALALGQVWEITVPPVPNEP